MKDKIIDIFWNKQSELEDELQDLEQKHEDREIYTSVYTPMRDVLEAKLTILGEIENEILKVV